MNLKTAVAGLKIARMSRITVVASTVGSVIGSAVCERRTHGFRFLPTVLSCALVSCSSLTTKKTPDLYPNAKLSETPRGQAQADVNNCLALADQYIKEPNRYGSMATQGLVGGAVGAGAGAVAGVIAGNAGRGTGAGAAVGGILGVLRGMSEMNERSPSYERFVEHCLQKQGYEITGWSSKSSG